VANVGKTRAITNQFPIKDWNLAIEEFHAARISQCLCLELFEISVLIPMLGGYHNFMIPTRSGFHKLIYKWVWFSQINLQMGLVFTN